MHSRNSCANHDAAWLRQHRPLVVEQQRLRQQPPPVLSFYHGYVYPVPPAQTPAIDHHYSLPELIPVHVHPNRLPNGHCQKHQQEHQDVLQNQERQVHVPVPSQHKQDETIEQQPETRSPPKLHTELLKSLIKPLDRSKNHEIPLPTQLECYFGKGWVCRYYHSTPAWGFIPPKGSGIRRADGFKALMARYELLDYRRKKNSEETKKAGTSGPVDPPRVVQPLRISLITGHTTSSCTNRLASSCNERSRHDSMETFERCIKRKRISDMSDGYESTPSLSVTNKAHNTDDNIKKPRLVSQEDINHEVPLIEHKKNSTYHQVVKSESTTSNMIINNVAFEELPHQVTFDTLSPISSAIGLEGVSLSGEASLYSTASEEPTSGIELLAHVASLLR